MKNKHHDKFDKKEEEIMQEEFDSISPVEDDTVSSQSAEMVEPEIDQRDQTIADLTAEIDATREKISQLTSHLQQLQADFDNYRKRNANISSEARQKGVFDAVKAILPAFDAVNSAQKQITDQTTLEGLEMVERELLNSLRSLEIEPIVSVGAQFDPNLHNVVFAEEVEGIPSGQILEEYSRGFFSPNGVVRFATVKIAK